MTKTNESTTERTTSSIDVPIDEQKQKRPRIRPVVIYPFSQPRDLEGLRVLYEKLSVLQKNTNYLKTTTIINNQTRIRCTRGDADPDLRNAFETAMADIVIDNVSYKTETWAVDTCAMWLRGLGDAYEHSKHHKAIHDVFWLIPGDFNFATEEGKTAVAKMNEIPENVLSGNSQICLGEIRVPLNSSKQLIYTYLRSTLQLVPC